MDALTVLLVALSLAMDCFSVSVTSGLTVKTSRTRSALRAGTFFGFFQAFMPVIGWLGGLSMVSLISGVDHWIAFGLLSLIGCKMIYEAIQVKMEERKVNLSNLHVLLMLSVATSIDALAVGIGLAFLKISIAAPILVIGTLTFVLSFIGVYVGSRFGRYLGNRMEIAGGFILICIGIKIVVEHLF